MVRNRKVFKKTVSIVNEKSTDMYESLVGDKKGFLLESYDKNYDRYTFFGMEPEEIVTSRGNALVITKSYPRFPTSPPEKDSSSSSFSI